MVEQDESSGMTYVKNLGFRVGGRPWVLKRPLNSRAAFPLYAERGDEMVEVLDGQTGELTPDFLELITGRL